MSPTMGTVFAVDVAHKLSILGEDLAVLEPLESDYEGTAAQRWEDFIAAGRVVHDHLLRLLPPLDPASLARIIAGAFYNGGPRATLEDQPLAVLSQGYDMSDSTCWRLSLASLSQPAPALAAIQETLGQLEELDSSQERLKRRHAYLNQFESSGLGASWSLHALAQIEVCDSPLNGTTSAMRQNSSSTLTNSAMSTATSTRTTK